MTPNRKTLLLVEDEAVIAISEAETLRKIGFSVVTAPTGERAIEIVHSGRDIDLILMDIDLGRGMNGIRAAEIIQAEHDIPVLFLSSHTEPEIVNSTDTITSYGYVVKNLGETVLIASIKMAFRLHEANRKLKQREDRLIKSLNERRQSAIALRESEERFRALVQNMEDFVVIMKPDGTVTYENPIVTRKFGYSMVGKNVFEIIHPDDIRNAIEGLDRVKLNMNLHIPSYFRARRHDDSWLYLESLSTNLVSNKYINGILVFCRDVTERKKAEEALRVSEENFRNIFNNAIEGIYQTTPEGSFINVNPAYAKTFGYPSPEDIMHEVTDLKRQLYANPTDREKLISMFEDQDNVEGFEAEGICRDGARRWISINASAIRCPAGNLKYITGTIIDITERKLAERALAQSHDANRVLLRELQHRVKNSLSIITGLIGIESSRMADPRLADVLTHLRNRVGSLSDLYDLLFRSQEVSETRLDVYIEQVSRSLLDSYSRNPGRITLALDLDEITIDVKRAMPIGLIINELLTNSVKYAYPDPMVGEIRVSLRGNDGAITLCVSDDGVGLPAEYDPDANTSTGLSLVMMLASQIDAGFEFKTGCGAAFLVSIPPPG